MTIGYGSPGCTGVELEFGTVMGDHFHEPVLLIKAAWGGHSLYLPTVPPPSAGYPIEAKLQAELERRQERVKQKNSKSKRSDPLPTMDDIKKPYGSSYRNMLAEVKETFDNYETLFPSLKGKKLELAGFVWFQGWNDMYRTTRHTVIAFAALLLTSLAAIHAADTDCVPSPVASQKVEANRVAEISLVSQRTYQNPFKEIELDAIVTQPDGRLLRVPAFWAGGSRWCFRYSSPQPGQVAWRTECSDRTNSTLHATEGKIEVVAYAGDNPLYRHGFIRVAKDRRHFEHADGTPFFWLGDTWWKGLCKRLTWEGFQELTADRRVKGFTVAQIVCGVYPDEGLFEPRWENEGGKPYLTRDFTVVNPAYFEYADRRIKHLVEAGIVPAIVGGWGRGDCNGMQMAGVAGIKRHWRNLIARFGAYPTVWIIGGESGGPEWTEVARYVQKTDPYRHPATIHPFNSARQSVTDETVIDFDMLQTGHGDWEAAHGAIPKLKAACARTPVMPALVGEYCYEGHMQTAFQGVQRYVFWGCMLSGAAGQTYGAAGIWHMSVEGDPGITPIYDWTTWKEGMNYPGSTQLGVGKKLLEKYPWSHFEPHPEWVEAGAFAAGIPGEVRFIYLPRRGVYNWNGPVVKQLERDVPYSAFYFNPTNGKRYLLGSFLCAGPPSKPFEGPTQAQALRRSFPGSGLLGLEGLRYADPT